MKEAVLRTGPRTEEEMDQVHGHRLPVAADEKRDQGLQEKPSKPASGVAPLEPTPVEREMANRYAAKLRKWQIKFRSMK